MCVLCAYVCGAHSLLVGPRPPTFHFNGCCLCCITHTHTSLRSRRRHTHTFLILTVARSLSSLELPSLWWRHFDSLPLLFLCNQFYFCRQDPVLVQHGWEYRDRKEESQWSWLILHKGHTGSVWAPDMSHRGLRGGESTFRTCQWVSV